ncbi:microcephalin [Amblyomma americanum]
MASDESPPSKKVRFAAAPSTPTTPRTGLGVPESVYRAFLAQPAHNPDGPLREVCAFVEVRVNTEDVSYVFESFLTRLGAKVRRCLGPTVTHVVFREGRVSTRNRARQLGIPVVGPLWIEECRAHWRMASPERFPANVSAAYDCPILSRKIRKPRSLRTKPDSPSPIKRPKRPRLLDLKHEALLESPLLSPGTKCLQEIVTRVKEQESRMLLNDIACTPLKEVPGAPVNDLYGTPLSDVPREPLREVTTPPRKCSPSVPPSSPHHRTSRRSLEDFEAKVSRARARALGQASWLEGPNLVVTGLEPANRDAVIAVVTALGGFTVGMEVTEHTTHVVCGTVDEKPRRTLSVLFALARGNCWLLPDQWAYRSLESGCWLDEEPFAFSRPRCVVKRKRKRTTCVVAPSQLLAGMGPFYVGPVTAPPPQRIRELLQLLGAEVSSSYLRCNVVLGDPQRRHWLSQVTHVSENWLLDCVSKHHVLPFDNYRLQKPADGSN